MKKPTLCTGSTLVRSLAWSAGCLAVKADCRSDPSSWSLLDTSQMHEVPTTDDCTHFLAKGGLTVRTYVLDSSQPNEKVQPTTLHRGWHV